MRWLLVLVMASVLVLVAGCSDSGGGGAPAPSPPTQPVELKLGADGSTPAGLVSFFPVDPGWIWQWDSSNPPPGSFDHGYWFIAQPLVLLMEVEWVYPSDSSGEPTYAFQQRFLQLAVEGRRLSVLSERLFLRSCPVFAEDGSLNDVFGGAYRYDDRIYSPPLVLLEDVAEPSDSSSQILVQQKIFATWHSDDGSQTFVMEREETYSLTFTVTVSVRGYTLISGEREYNDCCELTWRLAEESTEIDSPSWYDGSVDNVVLAPGVGPVRWSTLMVGEDETGDDTYHFERL